MTHTPNAATPFPGDARAILGRAEDLQLLQTFLDRAAADGAALLLSGEAGIGKTTLLDFAARSAAEAGMQVLRASGTEFEADVSYATLNQILGPLVDEIDQLPAAQSSALAVALGLADGPPPESLLVFNAAHALLARASRPARLLLIVDDLPWLDRPSAAVLAFIARRLAGSRISLLGAARVESERLLEWEGLPRHEVRALDEVSAQTLLDRSGPGLPPQIRQRLLDEAEGNPLALTELPAALSQPQRTDTRALPTVLPLSRRLQGVFATRVLSLPDATRKLLLLAALEGTGDLPFLGAAGGDDGLEPLAPAERARVVRVTDDHPRRVAFHHPLIRSAVVDLSTSSERREAHREIAALLTAQPERHAWHLGEATVDPDEHVAMLLEQSAYRGVNRGDPMPAVSALIRAAELSPEARDRGRRLVAAASLGVVVTGDLSRAASWLESARAADPELGESLQSASAAAGLLLNGDGGTYTAYRLLLGAIEHHLDGPTQDEQGLDTAFDYLLNVCLTSADPEHWQGFRAAFARVKSPERSLRLLAEIVPDPLNVMPGAVDRLDDEIRCLAQETHPTRVVRTAMAAFYLDRFEACREPVWSVIRSSRGGVAAVSARLAGSVHLCMDGFRGGRWDEVRELATEGLAACTASGYDAAEWPFRFSLSLVAAASGDEATATDLTERTVRWAGPRANRTAMLYSEVAWSLIAAGRGDFEESYRHATAISPPGALPPFYPHPLWVILDLMEAAARTDRMDEAAAHVAAIQRVNVAGISPRMARVAAAAEAIASSGSEAAECFDRALAAASPEEWPFERARIELLYGESLRRSRRVAEARVQLASAIETFRRLGAKPWEARASNELRAAGISAPGAGTTPDTLTPQEREISMLAASGLTNREIGARLFLSHRTVGVHLYRAFPKLGITSRAALRDALGTTLDEDGEARATPLPPS